MPDSTKLESLLVADIGSVNTKVGLVDWVGNGYRFVGAGVSATTAEPPLADVLVGVRRAIEQIEAHTNRQLLASDGQLMTPEREDGQGVDAFVAITSAPPPLRVAIVGLSREVSVASAARAIYGTYATVDVVLALDQMGGRWLESNAQRNGGGSSTQDPAVIAAETLARTNPDVIVLVGGINGGATTALYEITNLVAAIAATREDNARIQVIFAGNRDAQAEVLSRLERVAALLVVDNVHPALDRENPRGLQRELEALYEEQKIARLPGLTQLEGWTPVPVLPTAKGFEYAIRFLARRYAMRVLGADIGGASTTLVTARGESFSRAVRADLGLGHMLENVLNEAGIDRLMGWLPSKLDLDDPWAGWLNQAIHPGTIPATRSNAHLKYAAAREAFALTAREGGIAVGAVDLVVLTGGLLSRNSNLGALALVALDGLQPRGVFTLAIDSFGFMPAFGALAAFNAEAAASVIEQDGLVKLGTVIAPTSANSEGALDLRVKVQMAGSSTMNVDVNHGSLELIPLLVGQKASLEVRPASRVDMGSKGRGVFKGEIEGGALGLVIDARGRPIDLPKDIKRRRVKIQEWLWDMGG